MTDIKLIPDQKTLEERAARGQLLVDNKNIADVLFENATCLTANVLNRADFDYMWNLEQQYRKQHPKQRFYFVDEHTPLALHFRFYFHYFSNGVLVHRVLGREAESYIKHIKEMLSYHGYEIKKILGPKNSLEERAYRDVFISIYNKIAKTYVKKAKLAIKEIPDVDEFVEQCFSKNNVLLTATGDFNTDCREFLALFSSGHFYVSDEYKGEMSFKGSIPVYQFMDKHKYLVYFEPVYVPLQKYMKRLKITSEEALKVMQNQIYGWRNLLLMSEQKARSMIYSEYIENCLIESDEHFATQMATKKEFRIWGY